MLGFIIGILVAIFIYLFYEFCIVKKINFSQHFMQLRDSAAAQLKEKKNTKEKELNEEIEQFLEKKKFLANQEIENLENSYSEKSNSLKNQYEKLNSDLENDYEAKRKSIIQLEQSEAQERLKRNSQLIAKEQSNLEAQLKELTDDYETQKEKENINFLSFCETISSQKEMLEKEIKAFEEKQSQLIARFKQDEAVRAQRDFYKIQISAAAAQDIAKLKALATNFNNPNAIYKLIWEVYYKAPMEALFKKVLGADAKEGGIYKITNVNNEKVYVGRTVSFVERMRTHSKRGCGIDRIKGLLYDAMFDEGLENFTFEIIEICSKEEQPQKEKYWIDFYKSNEYGYNMNVGG